jgi:nucleotide-binding universal stress UspA family protein
MTLVLLAVDESEESIGAARQARRLFGADATYLAVYVSETVPAWTAVPTAWGSVYPYPYAAPYPLVEDDLADAGSDRPVREDARDTAEQLAGEAGIDAVGTVGEIGDPAEAILSAAERHGADVIVVGATHKNWWRRLLEGSVSQDLVRRSNRPVLIAGQDAADDA